MRWQESGVEWAFGGVMQVWVLLLSLFTTSQSLALSEPQFSQGVSAPRKDQGT